MKPNGNPTLKRELGIWTSTSLVVGNMIGAGIFLLPAALATYGGISILGWLFTAFGAMLLAMVFARLSKMLPKGGGPYAYTREGLGDFAAFLVAWGYWISTWSGNAAISVACVGYLAVFIPPLQNPVYAALCAVGIIWFLTFINSLGIKQVGILQLLTTILKIVPLLLIGILGIIFFDINNFIPFNVSGESNLSAIIATAAMTLWAMLGLEACTIPADNIKNPEKTIPHATIFGTLGAALVYIIGTVGVMGIISPADLVNSTAPFADAATKILGPGAGYFVAAGAAISCFGALNGWILMQGQLPMAVARDGLFPKKFAYISKNGTPVIGLVISSILITLLVGMNYTEGLVEQFTFIILLSTLTTLVPYLFSTMSELIIFAKNKETYKKEKLIAPSIIAMVAFLYSMWAVAGAGEEVVYWGFLLLMAGVPVYVWIKWRG